MYKLAEFTSVQFSLFLYKRSTSKAWSCYVSLTALWPTASGELNTQYKPLSETISYQFEIHHCLQPDDVSQKLLDPIANWGTLNIVAVDLNVGWMEWKILFLVFYSAQLFKSINMIFRNGNIIGHT